jgi:hypothetical protein
VGLTYVSSRLGSAIGSNAIKQDNIFLSGAYLFRMRRTVHPFVRANAGWFRADYESDIFKNLTNSSPLLSAELGLLVPTKHRINAAASLGYNLITGDGRTAPAPCSRFFTSSASRTLFLNPLPNETTSYLSCCCSLGCSAVQKTPR